MCRLAFVDRSRAAALLIWSLLRFEFGCREVLE
jgi:hypothetical protein